MECTTTENLLGYTGRHTSILQNLSAVHSIQYSAIKSVSSIIKNILFKKESLMKEILECILIHRQSTTGRNLRRLMLHLG